MPINKENSNLATVVFERDIYEQIKEVAKRNKRSISKQIAFWAEEMLRKEASLDESKK